MMATHKLLGIVGGIAVSAVVSLVGFGNGIAGRSDATVVPGAVPKDAPGAAQTTLLIRFGVTDREPAEWDGSIHVSPGKVERIDSWRFMQGDTIDGQNWTVSTRRLPPQSAAERERGADAMPIGDNGFFVTLADARSDSKVRVTTRQGEFDFSLADVAIGKPLSSLNGRVQVQRVPSSAKIISTPAEEDFPATAVAADGTAYVAYIAFTHGDGFSSRPPLSEPPNDFSFLDQPAKGDQLMLARFSPGSDGQPGTWHDPVTVTEPGKDLYKPAVAIDGSGRVWVFWSENMSSDGRGNGNWDLMARCLSNGQWSDPIRLSVENGSDVCPAAATDSDGRVWVVWQAILGEVSHILAARQEGDRHFRPIVISDAPGNKWCPAIAAGGSGEVAFAWDTYERGSYDIELRIFDGNLGPRRTVAATERYETRPSLAYDRGGRLWIAWEEGPEKWGKDFGAHEVDGWPLYRRHSVNVRVLSDGELKRTQGDIAAAFPARFEARSQAGASQPAEKPKKNQKAAKKNLPARGAGAHDDRQDNRPPTSLPRLAVDHTGRIWLAFRARTINTRATVGTIWHEFVTSYDGTNWLPGAIVPLSDALLDNRPAWAPFPDGSLALIGSGDGRHASIQGMATQTGAGQTKKKGGGKGNAKKAQKKAPVPDPVNNDLYAAWIPAGSGAVPQPVLGAAEEAEPGDPPGYVTAERQDVKRIRDFRTNIDGKPMRVVRGEFHRHTEISSDGGGDGSLEEMWRYGLDAAAMDWIGNGDHDNGGGREYTWWLIQKTTDIYTVDNHFTPLYTYERSVNYPDGHRNVAFARRGIRTLPRLQGGLGQVIDEDPTKPRPPTPDTQMLYAYLKHFGGVCASHTSGTNMGTDWRDNDPEVEPFVEIYQGDRQNYEMPGAPRSNTEDWSIGGWRPLGFVSLALKQGYRLAFQASSDHVSTHMSYCNVFVEQPTREAIVDAMRRRRVYGATDNIVADFRCGDHFMGEEFELDTPPQFQIHLIGTAPFERVHIVRNNEYVYSFQPAVAEVRVSWTDAVPPRGTNYYYVRGEQEDGELVWVSPIWIRNSAAPRSGGE